MERERKKLAEQHQKIEERAVAAKAEAEKEQEPETVEQIYARLWERERANGNQ